jgi:hypothetical protein
MKRDIAVIDALRSLIDYTELQNLESSRRALLRLLEDVSKNFDRKSDGSKSQPATTRIRLVDRC